MKKPEFLGKTPIDEVQDGFAEREERETLDLINAQTTPVISLTAVR